MPNKRTAASRPKCCGALAGAVPLADELPPALEEQLESLALLNDEALWQAARSTFSSDDAQQLEELGWKRQRESWTAADEQAAAALVQQYEQTLLVRAQAAVLLKQRGYDLSVVQPDRANEFGV